MLIRGSPPVTQITFVVNHPISCNPRLDPLRVIVRDRAFLFLSSKDRTQPGSLRGSGGREGVKGGGRRTDGGLLALLSPPLRNSEGDLSKAVDIFPAH